MKQPSWYLPRRTFLQAAGAGIALPFLEAMIPRSARAETAVAPRRFLAIWALPTGTVGRLDTTQNAWVPPWTPSQTGTGYTPNMQFLAPFFDARKLHEKLTIMTGLTDRSGRGHHFWGCGGYLTAQRVQCGDQDVCNRPVDVFAPSADQIAAEYFKQLTPIPSLTLATTPGPNGYSDYRTKISWKSRYEPTAQLIDPREVFNTLFGAGGGPSQDQVAAAKRAFYRKSVLDSVNVEAKSIRGRLGQGDSQKFDLYLDSIRELELQIENVGAPVSCEPGLAPTSPAPNFSLPYWTYPNLEVRLKVMSKLLVKAFECDRTRVASYMFVHAYGSHVGYPFIGINGYPHHTFSHYDQGTSPADTASRIQYGNSYGAWAIKMYADLLGEMDKIIDPDGSTALDNSVVYFSGEICDSAKHSYTSMPVLLGGRGGRLPSGAWGINSGRHVRFPKWQGQNPAAAEGYPFPPETPFSGERSVRDLLWGMLKTVGVPNVDKFGVATAPLDLSTL